MNHWNKKYPKRFDLTTEQDYKNWRKEKLANYPKNINELIVKLNDMTLISSIERKRIFNLIERANMCVFTSGSAPISMTSLLSLGNQLGVSKTDKSIRHEKSDELTNSGILKRAIPFSTRNIKWHTDATYYGSKRTIQTVGLLCKQPAYSGGSNELLDIEILYILLRDKSPYDLKTLMEEHCFIPKNPKTGKLHPELGGKVFWINPEGELCFRFSFRKMDMHWPDEEKINNAKKTLEDIINKSSNYVIKARLESGMGLISNNILHTREKFTDDTKTSSKRLLFRTRYYDRVNPH